MVPILLVESLLHSLQNLTNTLQDNRIGASSLYCRSPSPRIHDVGADPGEGWKECGAEHMYSERRIDKKCVWGQRGLSFLSKPCRGRLRYKKVGQENVKRQFCWNERHGKGLSTGMT